MKSWWTAIRSSPRLYLAILVVWLGYLASLMAPDMLSTIKRLSMTEVTFIRLSFALPILVIWMMSANAAVRLRRYARLIQGDKDGPGFDLVAKGLAWLSAYAVILLVLSRVSALLAYTSLVYPAIFLRNHLLVVVLLLAFTYLYRGTGLLLDLARITQLSHWTTDGVWLGYAVFACMFMAMFFNGDWQDVLINGVPAYVLSRWILLFSLAIPSVIAWGLGCVSVLNLWLYSHRVKGSVYRAALQWQAAGMGVLIGFTICVELLVLNAAFFQALGLVTWLVMMYLFLIAYGLGALLVAKGAKQLTLIEEAV